MNYKYKIPQYVEQRMTFYGGNKKGLIIFIPCLIIGVIMFFVSDSMIFKVLIPTMLVFGSNRLTTQQINRETLIEIISNKVRHKLQVKTLVWEQEVD
ncbi:hypothetical protein D3C74_91100 [compost metagenome]